MNPTSLGSLFEHRLGATSDATNPFSFEEAARADRENEFPQAAIERLMDDGYALRLIPSGWGGQLVHYQALHMEARCLTRRHMALMPAALYGVGPLTALTLAGTHDQKREALDDTTNGYTIAFGLSEANAGSDIATIETKASRDAGQWTLSGHKWIVGTPDRAKHLVVLARTDDLGPAGLSLFWTPTQNEALTIEAAEPMLGMRGVHFSGVRFDQQTIPSSSLIGKQGQGLELSLLCQQPIKLLSTAANLGASDTALRVAIATIQSDRAGRRLSELPHVRWTLSAAFADLLLLDSVTQAAVRSLSFAPDQCSLTASVAKFAALKLSRQIIENTALVMGSRALLDHGPWHGAFARARRDNEMLEAIDSNPVQNLKTIAMQLDALAASHKKPAHEPDTACYDLDSPCPEPMLNRLRLFNRSDVITESLPMIIEQVRQSKRAPPLIRGVLVDWLLRFDNKRRAIFDDLDGLRQREKHCYANSIALLEHSDHHARIHMAASAALTWLHSAALPDSLQSGAWLALALQRLYVSRHLDVSPPTSPILDEVWATCRLMSQENQLYSLTPFQLQS